MLYVCLVRKILILKKKKKKKKKVRKISNTITTRKKEKKKKGMYMFKQTKEINMYILKYKNKQLVKSL